MGLSVRLPNRRPAFALALLLAAAALHLGCGGDRSAAQTPAPAQATAPAITAQPASQSVTAGQAVTFTVAASGTAPLHYQWTKGTLAVGTDSPRLDLPSVQTTDAGTYAVAVSNTAGSAASAGAVLSVAAGPGALVWSDEFDGPTVDTTKWAFDLGNGPTSPVPLYGWGNGEMEYYTSSSDNVAIQDGSLVITARRQDWGGQPFTSARLVTRGKFSFNQGRFEARIKMPQGDRMWPAFWLLGDRGESWPQCGELDLAEMFCGAAGRGDNVVFATAHWWDEVAGQHEQNSGIFTSPVSLSADYHVYALDWGATTLTGSIDGTPYWTADITAATQAELRNFDYYLVLNLAVGSPAFGMTDPAQADGPLPQTLAVDYVRVYANAASTVVDEAASQPHGNFGVLPGAVACPAQLALGTDANCYLWNNLTAVPGATGLTVRATGSDWFGFGYDATKRRNLLDYAAGYLHFSLKTTATDGFQVGLSGGNDGDAWVPFTAGSDPYGFQRDGQWHAVAIPMTRFGHADFTDIVQFFMFESTGSVTPGATFAFDQIYWSEDAPENRARPVGTRFGIFTERPCDAGSLDPATDGAVQVWNQANFAAAPGTPFEGAASFPFTAPAPAWFGLGIAPAQLYDLSAFAGGHLHVALKVPAGTVSDFKLGLKSPGGTAVRESWIKFKAGSDPYGLVRDGQYHELMIPAADFLNSDFSALAQLFMLAGDGPAALEFDDVYLTVD